MSTQVLNDQLKDQKQRAFALGQRKPNRLSTFPLHAGKGLI